MTGGGGVQKALTSAVAVQEARAVNSLSTQHSCMAVAATAMKKVAAGLQQGQY